MCAVIEIHRHGVIFLSAMILGSIVAQALDMTLLPTLDILAAAAAVPLAHTEQTDSSANIVHLVLQSLHRVDLRIRCLVLEAVLGVVVEAACGAIVLGGVALHLV